MDSSNINLVDHHHQNEQEISVLSPIKSRNKLHRLNSENSEIKRQQQQSMIFERIKKPGDDTYMGDLNDDCSTEMGGFKS